MTVVPVELLGVRLEVPANTPIVLLQEAAGRRRVLPIYIGNNEAAAEREAAFVAQVVAPLLKQRNPEARRQAHTTAAELARLGRALRAAMLRMTLPQSLGE